MGEFPISLVDSSLHEVEISRVFEKENGIYIDLDDLGKECGFIDSNDKLRSLFNEALEAFLLSERSGRMCVRPVSVSGSDGSNVDFFKLFWVVRKIGGYDLVCSKSLWGFVAKHCGLASGFTAYLKLIYVRYLKEFDQWLWDFKKESNLDVESGTCRKSELLVQELETVSEELLMRKGVENKNGLYGGGSVAHPSRVGDVGSREGKKSDDNCDDAKVPSESKKDLATSKKRRFEEVVNEIRVDAKQPLDEDGGKASVLEDTDSSVSAKRVGRARDIAEVQKKSESDTNHFIALANDNIMLVPKNDLEQGFDSPKLKREPFSFTNLLVWTRHAAKSSDDPRIGKMPKCSKWENHAWLFALLLRKARFFNGITRSTDDASQLEMMVWTGVSTDNVKTRTRRALCKECLPAKSGDKEKESGPKVPERNKGRARNGKQVMDKDGIEYKLSYESRTHDIMVGPEYQAEIPEWTGNAYESDSKWLGTRISSPEEEEEEEKEGERKPPLSLVPVGRGRKESSCDCEWKDSVECVRLHVAEKRLVLKTELGSLFYKWRFDRMGEEVSLSWTPEEEDKFKGAVRSNAGATYLWKKLGRMFPSMTRERLVNYYFNVYINQVRSYQNRTTPREIDSDTEEGCGTIGERFGYRTLKAPDSCSQLCIENKQSFEFQ